jgi:hypothetical protein
LLWDTFVRQVLTTPQGQNLIMVGNVVGFLFAVLAFSVSLVSFPLLLDRNVGVAVAIVTSIKAILKNPITMTLWGLFVAGALAIGSLPFFIGLAVVMPCSATRRGTVSKSGRAGSGPAAGVSSAPERPALRCDFPVSAVSCRPRATRVENGR